MNIVQQSLHSFIDNIFVFSNADSISRGEDSFCCNIAPNGALLGVFDGSGGLGSRKYSRVDNCTGAYLASRIASGATYDWFKRVVVTDAVLDIDLSDNLKSNIQSAYKICAPFLNEQTRLKGSMVRSLPTTAAIALILENATGIPELHCIWAGDSRIYLLDKDGMAVLTSDDCREQDALANLQKDSVITNVISSDGQYVLHHNTRKISPREVVIAATDGCFGYYRTPMEFEFSILSALEEAENMMSFKSELKSALSKVSQDDMTFGFLCYGFGTFGDLKKNFHSRYLYLKSTYMESLKNDPNTAVVNALWNNYKKSYERCKIG